MAQSTTPLAPNQASGFNVPKPATVNPNFDLSKNMTIGQFGLNPTTNKTTTPAFSPTQGGLNPAAGVINPTMPTSTGFTAGPNNIPMATNPMTGGSDPATSAWSSSAVASHPAATGTNVSSTTAMQNQLDTAKQSLLKMQASLTTPPVPSAPTQTQGAGTGGGQASSAAPFQGNYTFDSQGNVMGQTSATQGSDPNPAAQTSTNPASTTSAQTNAIIQSLQNSASQGSQGDPAEQALQDKIQKMESDYGTQLGNITGSEMPQAFETGAANVLTQQFNPQLQSLTNQLGQLQANRTASLTAANNAGGLSNNLQSLQQQNQAISPGQSLYNLYSGNNTANSALPLASVGGGVGLFNQYTGQQAGGNATLQQLGGGGAMTSLAQQVLNHQLTEQQAESQLPSGVPAAALNQEEQRLQPGFNTNTATAQAQATASNVGTAGTAQTTANQGIYNTATQSLATLENAAANIQSFGNQAIQNISQLGLSPSQTINSAIQAAQTQINNPAYARFNTNIQGLKARVSDLLATGEIPTSASAGAESIINGNLNLGSLQSTLDQINGEAASLVQNQAQIASSAYSNIQGGNQGSSASSGGSVSAGGYSFKQVNGKWVAQ